MDLAMASYGLGVPAVNQMGRRFMQEGRFWDQVAGKRHVRAVRAHSGVRRTTTEHTLLFTSVLSDCACVPTLPLSAA